MTQDGAAVTGLAIAAASLVAVKVTGNPIYDPIGSIVVGNLLGMVRASCYLICNITFAILHGKTKEYGLLLGGYISHSTEPTCLDWKSNG